MSWYAIDPATGDVVGVEHERVADALEASGWDVASVPA